MSVIIRWERATLGDLAFLALCEAPTAMTDFRIFTALITVLERLVEGGVAHRPIDELAAILDEVQRGLLNYTLWREPRRADVAWGAGSVRHFARPPKNLN
jgi:hypothetical protein